MKSNGALWLRWKPDPNPTSGANARFILTDGEALDDLGERVQAGTQANGQPRWWRAVRVTRPDGQHVGFCAEEFLAGVPGSSVPPVVITPGSAPVVDGFHFMDQGVDFTVPLALANAGKLAMLTCLEGNGVSGFIGKVPYVVQRPYLVPGLNAITVTGTEADIETAKTWFNNIMVPRIGGAAAGTIWQGPCEGHSVKRGVSDAYWYIGFMQACEARGHKAVIFNDSVASFAVLKYDGWSSAQLRYPALKYAKEHGHFVGAHMYGAPGKTPGSGTTDEEWLTFAGRWELAYSEIPEDGWADVLGTEAGLFEVKYNQQVGAEFIANDIKGFRKRAASWPVLKGIAYWTCGHWADIPESQLDGMMKDIAARL